MKRVSTGSNNGLSTSRCQAIVWTNAGIVLIRSLARNRKRNAFISIHENACQNVLRNCVGLTALKDALRITSCLQLVHIYIHVYIYIYTRRIKFPAFAHSKHLMLSMIPLYVSASPPKHSQNWRGRRILYIWNAMFDYESLATKNFRDGTIPGNILIKPVVT